MSSATDTIEPTDATPDREPAGRARGVAALSGQSRALVSGSNRGRVPGSVRRGRPALYTGYGAQQALLNTPAKRGWALAALLAALIAPFMVTQGMRFLLTMTIVYAIAGIGLNLLTGYAGQISLGHPFFMAVGAYTAAVLGGTPGSTVWGLELDLSIALLGAAVVPALLGLVFAPMAVRVRGLYLAILTLGLLYLGEHVLKEWSQVTGGMGVSRGGANRTLFGVDLTQTYAVAGITIPPSVSLYLISLVILVALGLGARNLARSRTGRAFAAVRDRDMAAEIMGINLLRTKTLAFVLSSAYAGVAGALFMILMNRVQPDNVWDIHKSIMLLAIVVIGGVATISGTLIGAAFVTLLPELLRNVAPYLPFVAGGPGQSGIDVNFLQSMLFGALIVLFLLLEPRGLFGLWYRVRIYFKTWPFRY